MSAHPATIPPRFHVGDRVYRIQRGEDRISLAQWQESCPGVCEMYVVTRVTAKQVWAESVFAFLDQEERPFVLSREKLERNGYAFGRDWTLFFVSMPEKYRRLTLGFLREQGPRQFFDLPESYTQEDLKSAYRLKALQAHPDRPGGSHEAFLQVQAAYEALRQ
jgi:hypothetical protein